MAHKKLPVIAAIPNYNMAKGLKRLLPQVLKQDYDHVYVLDDFSTDNSEKVVKSFGDRVTFVKSEKNGGGGAARNKLIPFLKKPCLIHFMDADISILSKNTPEIIQDLPIDEHTAFVGGLVLDKNGYQSVWNYGPIPSMLASLSSVFLYRTRQAEDHFRLNLSAVYFLMKRRPNPHKTPRETSIFWPLETSCVVHSDTFLQLGGFDETIRENDIQPLVMKAAKRHLKSYFSPLFIVQDHDDMNVRSYNRPREMRRTGWYVVKKYWGLKRWFFPFLKK